MRRARAYIVALAAVGLALGGAVSAFAAFHVEATDVTMTFKTVTMPGFDSGPAVEAHRGSVKIDWVAQKIVKGVNVERYLVTRYNVATDAGQQVCGDSVTGTRCTDVDVPAGRWKYTVRTVQGAWLGPESKRSDVVKIEAAAPANKNALVGDEAPAKEPSQKVVAPAATPVSPPSEAVGPSAEPSTGEPDSTPPVEEDDPPPPEPPAVPAEPSATDTSASSAEPTP